MLKVTHYTAKGVKSTDFSLPKEMDVKENINLMAQAVRVAESKKHPGLSKVKTRSEINRTTKKWYRQKGTGRARHGARSAPIFVGGGVAHGPKGIKRTLNLTKDMNKKALFAGIKILSKKGKVFVVSGVSSIVKTKDAKILLDKIIKNLNLKTKVTFVFAEKNIKVKKAFNNIKNIKTEIYKNINVRKILLSEYLIFDKDVFEKEAKKDK
jgi:large subunit ribosomal protein L4